MRPRNSAVWTWTCVGICAVSLAVLAGAGKCCIYIHVLTDGPGANALPATCTAGTELCSCEKNAVDAPLNGQGGTNRGFRLARCRCYKSPNSQDYIHTDCNNNPGPGWEKMSPPLDATTNPPICCWVNTWSVQVVTKDRTFQVDDCGVECKNH